MESKILKLFNKIKLNFADCLIERDDGYGFEPEFEINPRDFLHYSKEDLDIEGDRGIINSISNAKRAIDCQNHVVFNSYGLLNPKNDFKNDKVNEYIKITQSRSKVLNLKFHLINSLNFAPISIVSNGWKLRNKIEHIFDVLPKKKEVEDFIDYAEAYIQCIESKTKVLWNFIINNSSKSEKDFGSLINCVYVTYSQQDKCFDIQGFDNNNNLIEKISVGSESLEYFGLIKISSSFNHSVEMKNAIIEFLKIINHPIPSKSVNVLVLD